MVQGCSSWALVAIKSHFDEAVELIRDKRRGTTRDMMTLRLPSLNRERVIDVLIESFADDEIAGHAILALGAKASRGANSKSNLF
jgi:hypothetical protein